MCRLGDPLILRCGVPTAINHQILLNGFFDQMEGRDSCCAGAALSSWPCIPLVCASCSFNEISEETHFKSLFYLFFCHVIGQMLAESFSSQRRGTEYERNTKTAITGCSQSCVNLLINALNHLSSVNLGGSG